ncbi:very short patch repair endonuclease [Pedobacter hiemivivus]|nr:very short patch repair endonuclease [Pedobacter hiemivivus]
MKYTVGITPENKTMVSALVFIMADVHSKETRSYNMSKIKGKDTKPELLVRKFLHKNGFRYRIHVKDLPGKPDVVLPRYKTVIFINGCFWHGHEECKYYVIPKTRTDWWLSKINGNIANDFLANEQLTNKGWKVIIIWECQLKERLKSETLDLLLSTLKVV